MAFESVYEKLKTYFDNTIVKHFAYDENETNNEVNETVYSTPAIFVEFLSIEGVDSLFTKYSFKLKLEVRTVARLNTTLDTLDSVKSLIKSFDEDGQRIGIKSVKPSHKNGNSAAHIFDCYLHTRN